MLLQYISIQPCSKPNMELPLHLSDTYLLHRAKANCHMYLWPMQGHNFPYESVPDYFNSSNTVHSPCDG